ncbi:MAG: hypothetical protein LBG78_01995 [Azoarcus sp.]|nr:hypothetical protein [Azoarcus sp.]
MNAVTWILVFLLAAGLLSGLLILAYPGSRFSKRIHWNRSGIKNPPVRIYRYRAMELRLCDNPCESALAIAGKRLLKSEAPNLPLQGCRHKKCQCSYTQYDDRRFMQRRESSRQGRLPGRPYPAQDRRQPGTDRRGRI